MVIGWRENNVNGGRQQWQLLRIIGSAADTYLIYCFLLSLFPKTTNSSSFWLGWEFHGVIVTVTVAAEEEETLTFILILHPLTITIHCRHRHKVTLLPQPTLLLLPPPATLVLLLLLLSITQMASLPIPWCQIRVEVESMLRHPPMFIIKPLRR